MSDSTAQASQSQPQANVASASDSPASSAAAAKADFSDSPSLVELQRRCNEFTTARDWDQFHQPRNLMLALTGEVGELAEIFMWRGECPVGLPGWSEKDRHHLGQELSDCLIYLIRLATVCGIDLPAAAAAKIVENGRKYPTDKSFGSTKKYTDL
ncbi:RS21-C6 protein [Capsaspora owczarzaki ATCC 30864]|uniref:dCTP pyrophosphatase 1 n=1 Tax=Capsaspora owczarzaki (strain ATCC 30864) TaxID=595528 RepID=A0A0D2WSU4_CAPO3|nr:RS21-C6 protein [Capsaspora owczarzaki ATCC 30864]KJE95385.1 RS21-C6 protein [Capsaspora owczarzaki ATCC 30864]|eukprot:XP_004345428.1 RS21-C6 protein [Capsaspora owczarzaki ATCC 30864]